MKKKAKQRNKHWGSSLDDLLRSEGKLQEFRARAINEVRALSSKRRGKPIKRPRK
jgi:hypothetical protein